MEDLAYVSLDELIHVTHEAERSKEWTFRAEKYCLELFKRALMDKDNDAFTAICEIFRYRVESWLRKLAYGDNHVERDYFRDQAISRFYFALNGEKYIAKGGFRSHRQLLAFWRRTTETMIADYFRKGKRETPFIDLPNYIVDQLGGGDHNHPIDDNIVSPKLIEDRLEQLLTGNEFEIAELYYVYHFKPAKIREYVKSNRSHLVATASDEETLRVTLQRIKRKLMRDPTLIAWGRAYGMNLGDS